MSRAPRVPPCRAFGQSVSSIAAGACLSVLALAPGLAHAEDYWVAPGGSSSNPGTMAMPWQTLQYAADQVNPGDTVHVLPGDYVGFDLTRGGTAGMPVRFIAEGPGVNVTTRNMRTPDGINIEGADHVVVEGFTVNGMPRAGLRCVLSSSVTFRGNRADMNQSWGMLTGCCPDLLIERNVTTRSVVEHGIYVSNSADNPVIRYNTSWGNRATGST